MAHYKSSIPPIYHLRNFLSALKISQYATKQDMDREEKFDIIKLFIAMGPLTYDENKAIIFSFLKHHFQDQYICKASFSRPARMQAQKKTIELTNRLSSQHAMPMSSPCQVHISEEKIERQNINPL